MTVQEIKTRIEKKEQEIAKREKNLVKYIVDDEFTAIVERFIETGDRTELNQYRKAHELMFFPDYYSKRIELEEARKTLAKYQAQLEAEEAKEGTLSEMPAVLVEFKEYVIQKWDEYDQWKRQSIREDYRQYIEHVEDRKQYLENRHMMHDKWGAGYYDFMYITDEQIHKANVAAANQLVLNLLERTVAIAGKIVDCRGLHIDRDNAGYSIINGLVIGEKGKARVESIGAGGYNIQRYHIRVLVKEVK